MYTSDVWPTKRQAWLDWLAFCVRAGPAQQCQDGSNGAVICCDVFGWVVCNVTVTSGPTKWNESHQSLFFNRRCEDFLKWWERQGCQMVVRS